MAKRFTKPATNWKEMEKLVPPEQRTKFFVFKAKSDSYFRRVLSNPPEPPKIDWDTYRKTVPVEGLVDKFKSAYESFKVPFPEENLTAKVDEQVKAIQPEISSFCKEMDDAIATANKELARIKALPTCEETTLEMYYELFPNEALNPVDRPTYWPHNPEEQLDYKPPSKGTEHKK